jgi:Tfp pilus assembly protein PilO
MMQNIDWGRAGTSLVWIILIALAVFLYLCFAVWLGEKLHQADVRQQEEVSMRSVECQRQAVLLTIAEEVEAMPDSPERRRLYREAELLGFLDSDDLPRSA